MPEITCFCVKSRFVELMGELCRSSPLQFVKSESYREPVPVIFGDVESFAETFCSRSGDMNMESYMTVPVGLPIVLTPIPQQKGGVRYLYEHPRSALQISPGGFFEDKALICTRIASLEVPEVKPYFGRARRYIKKHFLKVGGSWIAPEAEALRQGGLRLSESINRPLWADPMTFPEKYNKILPLLGTELDTLFYLSEWVAKYERGEIHD